MKRVLLSVCLLVALVASLLIACPCVAADSTPAYGVIAEERVINLPADQNKWYVSVIGDPTNARYQTVLSWFDTNQKLKALKNRVHFCPVTSDSAVYKERYAGNVRALPTIRLQKPDGTIIYEAWDKYIPMTPEGLYADMADNTQAAAEGRPYLPWRRNHVCPKPQPQPQPNPDTDPEPQPLDPDEPIIEPDQQAEGAPLWMLAVLCTVGFTGGICVGYWKPLKDRLTGKA